MTDPKPAPVRHKWSIAFDAGEAQVRVDAFGVPIAWVDDGEGREIPHGMFDELDRLAARVAELEGALRGLVSDQHGHAAGCLCPWCNARAALKVSP